MMLSRSKLVPANGLRYTPNNRAGRENRTPLSGVEGRHLNQSARPA